MKRDGCCFGSRNGSVSVMGVFIFSRSFVSLRAVPRNTHSSCRFSGISPFFIIQYSNFVLWFLSLAAIVLSLSLSPLSRSSLSLPPGDSVYLD